MPTIPKKKKKKHQRKNGSEKLYNIPEYRKIRDVIRSEQPLCLMCLKEGKTVPTEAVHHIHQFSLGKTLEEQVSLLLNPANLIGVCQDHHQHIHGLYKISDRKEKETQLMLQKLREDYYSEKEEFLNTTILEN